MNKLIVCILLPVCLLALSSSYAQSFNADTQDITNTADQTSSGITKTADQTSSDIQNAGKSTGTFIKSTVNKGIGSCRKNEEKCGMTGADIGEGALEASDD